MKKIGRNDPCPCGSGQKYKKCCMVKSYSPNAAGKEQSINQRLVQDIIVFTREHYGHTIEEAYQYFWGDFDLKEHLDSDGLDLADINFGEWLVYDWEPEEDGEKKIIDLYMEKARGLSEDYKDILFRMKDALISLYEIQEVFYGEGLLVKDILSGEEYNVKEKTASMGLVKWDIFAARLLRLDDNVILSGCLYHYPAARKDTIINHIKKYFKDYQKKHAQGDIHGFLRRNSNIFNFYWCESFRNPFRPTLMTTTGEPVVFSVAIFEICDRDVVLKGLKKISEFEETEKGVMRWLGKPKANDSSTILGIVRIQGNKLKLECNSRERLERGKVLLINNLSGSISHKVDTVQDIYQAMKNMPIPPQNIESGIPKEIEMEMYNQLMRKHYERWLDEEIPALGGNTPLETVGRPHGKKKVAELLKGIENMEERRKLKGEPWFDTSWLWEKLGLER